MNRDGKYFSSHKPVILSQGPMPSHTPGSPFVNHPHKGVTLVLVGSQMWSFRAMLFTLAYFLMLPQLLGGAMGTDGSIQDPEEEVVKTTFS